MIRIAVFVSPDLSTCTHVFVRDERVWPPFSPPYDRPFSVVKRTDKFFTILKRNKPVEVYIDRLKSCYEFNVLGNSDNSSTITNVPEATLVSSPIPRMTLTKTTTKNFSEPIQRQPPASTAFYYYVNWSNRPTLFEPFSFFFCSSLPFLFQSHPLSAT